MRGTSRTLGTLWEAFPRLGGSHQRYIWISGTACLFALLLYPLSAANIGVCGAYHDIYTVSFANLKAVSICGLSTI